MKTNPKAKSAAEQRREPATPPEQVAAAQALAAGMPSNTGKAKEFGRENAVAPARGATVPSESPAATASTLSEVNASAKTGAGAPPPGRSALPDRSTPCARMPRRR